MGRKRIRDIDNSYHCSIIGTCLTLGEVRALFEKIYGEDLSECSDYTLHGMAVKGAGELSRFSNKLTEKLNSKYKADVFKSSKLNTRAEIEKFWKSSVAEGNVSGPYWAVLSHLGCTEELRSQVFGEVHMMSHLSGACERTNIFELKDKDKRIDNLVAVIEKLRLKMNDTALKSRALVRENRILLQERSEPRLMSVNDSILTESDFAKLNYKIEKYKRKFAVSEKRNKELEARLFRLTEELNSSKELNKVMNNFSVEHEDHECCDTSAAFIPSDLQGRKVLLVGGRVSMVPHCKYVVEAMNGKFFYHDGGKEQSRTALQKIVLAADVVICALDCVSHDASRCVKRMCCEEQRVIMMKNSGLSTFTRKLKSAV